MTPGQRRWIFLAAMAGLALQHALSLTSLKARAEYPLESNEMNLNLRALAISALAAPALLGGSTAWAQDGPQQAQYGQPPSAQQQADHFRKTLELRPEVFERADVRIRSTSEEYAR